MLWITLIINIYGNCVYSLILKVWHALFIVAVRSFLPSDQWWLGEGGGGLVSRSVGVEVFIVVGWTLAGRTSRAHSRLLQHIRQLIESLREIVI